MSIIFVSSTKESIKPHLKVNKNKEVVIEQEWLKDERIIEYNKNGGIVILD